LPEVRTLLSEDFAGSKKVQEGGLLALGYAALLPHLQQQRIKGLNLDSVLRFEQRTLAPESRLERRERFYAAFGHRHNAKWHCGFAPAAG
jgi:hypothetical protein